MRTPDEVKAKIDGYVQKLLRTTPADAYSIIELQARVDMLIWVLNEKDETAK